MSKFNNINLLYKIAFPIAILVCVSVGLICISMISLSYLKHNTNRITSVTAVRLESALRMASAINETTIQMKNAMLLRSGGDDTPIKSKFALESAKATSAVQRLGGLTESRSESDADQNIKMRMEEYLATATETMRIALLGDKVGAVRRDDEAMRPARRALVQLIDQRVESSTEELETAKRQADDLANLASWIMIGSGSFGLILAVCIVVAIIVYGVARPMQRVAAAMSGLAEGNLEVTVAGTDRQDEVGSLARSLQVFKDNAMTARRLAAEQDVENQAKMRRAERLDQITKSFEHNVSAMTQSLAGASTEMEATAQSMASIAAQTTERSVIVASSAEETSANVQTVAAASEEMSASVHEIVSQVSQSSQIAYQAVENAKRTEGTVKRLASTAERISDFVSVIANIASQTNLLALNATIEAARAGEAGRGFAVVASEVKELAGQTAKATGEIGERITEIQAATQEAVTDIEVISRVIDQMSSYAASISAAMEEQGAATQEITRNVQEAAKGTEQVTTNISVVREGAGQTGAAASQVLTAAKELSRQSESLSQEVGTFLANVKAA